MVTTVLWCIRRKREPFFSVTKIFLTTIVIQLRFESAGNVWAWPHSRWLTMLLLSRTKLEKCMTRARSMTSSSKASTYQSGIAFANTWQRTPSPIWQMLQLKQKRLTNWKEIWRSTDHQSTAKQIGSSSATTIMHLSCRKIWYAFIKYTTKWLLLELHSQAALSWSQNASKKHSRSTAFLWRSRLL